MSWKDPFITITFPSKVVLTISSILLFLIHTGIIVGDLYHFLGSQRVDLMSFHYTITLLFSQVVSFYWALLATIYTLQAEDSVLMCFALTSFALNFAVFIVRFIMEYLTIAYREEHY